MSTLPDRPPLLCDAIASIIRDVAELPDRTSQADNPSMMLVTERELHNILWSRLKDGWPTR